MTLSHEQLNTIVARSFPGDWLEDAVEITKGRYAIDTAGGDQFQLYSYDTSDQATAAIAALRQLRSEIDLPIPQLQAADAEGKTVGYPYAILSPVSGEPLTQVVAQLNEEQLYAIGRKLGEITYRIHRLAWPHYGHLKTDNGHLPEDERTYVLSQLDHALTECEQLTIIPMDINQELRVWFESEFQPVGQQAALLHGNLAPTNLLIRQIDGRWSLSGIIGWENAIAWCPAWEHVAFLSAIEDSLFFSLRVGYGNGYDEQTQRTYEQVREPVMIPYRILWLIQRLRQVGQENNQEATTFYQNTLQHMWRAMTDEIKY
ncbi:MAG: aminoglycoside phosphotransferase family protein [Chloroflexota bacterium]